MTTRTSCHDNSPADHHGNHGSTTESSKATSQASQETMCAEALEQEHVHNVYDQTAHYFKDVRYRAWPKVRQFLSSLEPGSIVADIGKE